MVSLPAEGLVDSALDEALTTHLTHHALSWHLVDPDEIAYLDGRTTGFDARPWTVIHTKRTDKNGVVHFGPNVKLLAEEFTVANLEKVAKRFGNPSEGTDEGVGLPLLFLGALSLG